MFAGESDFAKGYVQESHAIDFDCKFVRFFGTKEGGGDLIGEMQKVRLRPTDQLPFNSPAVQ